MFYRRATQKNGHGPQAANFMCLSILVIHFFIPYHPLEAQVLSPESLDAAETLKRLESDPEFLQERLQWDVFLLDTNTGKETRLTNTAGEDDSPALSRDETKLAYTAFGRLEVLDLANSVLLYVGESEHNYYGAQWLPVGSTLSVLRTVKRAAGEGEPLPNSSELVHISMMDHSTYIYNDPTEMKIRSYDWDPKSSRLAMIVVSFKSNSQQLLIRETTGDNRIVTIFDSETTPLEVMWSSVTNQLVVLAHKKNGQTLLAVDLANGVVQELHQLAIEFSQLDLSAFNGVFAISDQARCVETLSIPDELKVQIVHGIDVAWAGDNKLLYRSLRLPEGYKEALQKGVLTGDERMYLLTEDGDVLIMKDIEEKHSLYVIEERIEIDGDNKTILKDLTLSEAKAFAAERNKHLVIEQDGFRFTSQSKDGELK